MSAAYCLVPARLQYGAALLKASQPWPAGQSKATAAVQDWSFAPSCSRSTERRDPCRGLAHLSSTSDNFPSTTFVNKGKKKRGRAEAAKSSGLSPASHITL